MNCPLLLVHDIAPNMPKPLTSWHFALAGTFVAGFWLSWAAFSTSPLNARTWGAVGGAALLTMLLRFAGQHIPKASFGGLIALLSPLLFFVVALGLSALHIGWQLDSIDAIDIGLGVCLIVAISIVRRFVRRRSSEVER